MAGHVYKVRSIGGFRVGESNYVQELCLSWYLQVFRLAAGYVPTNRTLLPGMSMAWRSCEWPAWLLVTFVRLPEG